MRPRDPRPRASSTAPALPSRFPRDSRALPSTGISPFPHPFKTHENQQPPGCMDPPAAIRAGPGRRAALLLHWHALRPFVETHPDTVLLLDHGHVVASNRAFGRPFDDLPGAPFLDLVAPTSRAEVEAALAQAEQRKPTSAGARVESRWFDLRIAPAPEGAVVVFAADSTERRAEEERLHRSERLMVDTQGVAHLGTWEWDIKEPHARWSNELYRIYGLDPATHVPSYEDYLTRVHPDDVERVKRMTERVFNDHLPYSHDERIRHTDGQWRWLHTWAEAVLDADGKLERLVGVCLDITDRRNAELELEAREAHLRAVFDRSPLAMVTLGADGRFAESNAVAQVLLGYDAPGLRARLLKDLVRPVDLPRLSDLEAGQQAEVSLIRPDGRATACRLTASRVDGVSPFTIVMIEDVSATQRIHELEEASAWKTQLLGLASHEIKNPLTPLKVQVHLLREGVRGPLTKEQAQALDLVKRQTDRLEKLVHDVLDLSRIEQGRLEVRKTSVDVERVVKQVEAAFRPVAESWGVAFEAAIAPATAYADSDRLHQVLYNLVGNALKFTPAGGKVRLEVRQDREGAHVIVSDTGPGLSAAQQERLFRPFSQVHDDASKSREAGAGLGLFLCRRIVDAFGGRIWVESEPGKGAAFHVMLP